MQIHSNPAVSLFALVYFVMAPSKLVASHETLDYCRSLSGRGATVLRPRAVNRLWVPDGRPATRDSCLPLEFWKGRHRPSFKFHHPFVSFLKQFTAAVIQEHPTSDDSVKIPDGPAAGSGDSMVTTARAARVACSGIS